jgi:hypothetical protein
MLVFNKMFFFRYHTFMSLKIKAQGFKSLQSFQRINEYIFKNLTVGQKIFFPQCFLSKLFNLT